MDFRIEALSRTRHDRSAFDCGESSLDEWLKKQAGQSDRQDAARTYVACDDGGVVLGYYSLCSFSVHVVEAPERLRVGRHPIPAVLLARLAVDRRRQRAGLGGCLLVDALGVSALVADQIGARVLVVHAVDAAAAEFYRRHGFTAFEHHRLTLYLPMHDIRATLEAAGLR